MNPDDRSPRDLSRPSRLSRPGADGTAPDRRRRRPLPPPAAAAAALLVALLLAVGGCAGEGGPEEDPAGATGPPADAAPQAPGAEATGPGTTRGAAPGAAGPEGGAEGGGEAASPEAMPPAGPGNPDPGLDPEPYRVDEMEDGKVDDDDMAGEDGEPLVPRGFEDVAPGSEGGLVEGPFTGGDDEETGAEEGPATGEEGAVVEGAGEDAAEAGPVTVETIWVYLVEPAEAPPADALGRGEAGAGVRQRPPTTNNGEYAGSFGCGDRLVGMEVELEEPVEVSGPEEHLRLVLRTLLGLAPDAVPGDLLNALRRSPLQVDAVEASPGRSGVYKARLSGPLRLGGTCDTPRVRAQLTATGEQVEGVDEVEVFLGDEPLEVVLSTRGLANR